MLNKYNHISSISNYFRKMLDKSKKFLRIPKTLKQVWTRLDRIKIK